jgi:hypothetical protein
MNDVTPEVRQQRAKEFMQILPLTIELAGLPHGTLGTFFTSDQMDQRVITLKNAYKLARKLLKEISEEG